MEGAERKSTADPPFHGICVRSADGPWWDFTDEARGLPCLERAGILGTCVEFACCLDLSVLIRRHYFDDGSTSSLKGRLFLG